MNKKFIEECEEAYWKTQDRFPPNVWEYYIPYEAYMDVSSVEYRTWEKTLHNK